MRLDMPPSVSVSHLSAIPKRSGGRDLSTALGIRGRILWTPVPRSRTAS